MEPPVCCVHSAEECRLLIQRARTGAIRRTRARLTDSEKKRIRPGDVYVYSEDESGIRRWTDKKAWTPSRVQGAFLVYRDLAGPFVKKTYSCVCDGGRFHVVVYTLAEWEDGGRCCVLFKDALAGLADAPGHGEASSVSRRTATWWGDGRGAAGAFEKGGAAGRWDENMEDFGIYLNSILDTGKTGFGDACERRAEDKTKRTGFW